MHEASPDPGSPCRFGAIVLAAGLSQRMGSPKPLLPFGQQPLLVHIVRTVAASGTVGPVCVVTGHERDRVAGLLRDFPIRVAHNPAYASGGMLSSIQVGVATVKDECDAFFIVLGDQPLVKPSTIAAMTRAWVASRPSVMLPTYAGKHGHPVLLSSRESGEILSLPPDSTLKTYTSRRRESTIDLDVDDPAILEDIDTPADYEAAVKKLRSDSCPDPS